MKSFTSVSGGSWLQGRRLLPLLKHHGANVTGTVLDLGCGHSPFRPFFAAADRYMRMDRYPVDPEVLVIEDPRALPLADGSVDIIILSRMMGDLPDVVGVLRECYRVLRIDGKILVYESMSYPQHDLPHDYWRVLPAGLEWAANHAALELQQLEYLGGYFMQLAMHWNHFIVGNFNRVWLTRPIATAGRAAGNLVFAGLDALVPRPILATDYFACIVKRATTSRSQ